MANLEQLSAERDERQKSTETFLRVAKSPDHATSREFPSQITGEDRRNWLVSCQAYLDSHSSTDPLYLAIAQISRLFASSSYTKERLAGLQDELYRLGYLDEETDIDGLFGPNTLRAMTRAVRKAGMTEASFSSMRREDDEKLKDQQRRQEENVEDQVIEQKDALLALSAKILATLHATEDATAIAAIKALQQALTKSSRQNIVSFQQKTNELGLLDDNGKTIVLDTDGIFGPLTLSCISRLLKTHTPKPEPKPTEVPPEVNSLPITPEEIEKIAAASHLPIERVNVIVADLLKIRESIGAQSVEQVSAKMTEFLSKYGADGIKVVESSLVLAPALAFLKSQKVCQALQGVALIGGAWIWYQIINGSDGKSWNTWKPEMKDGRPTSGNVVVDTAAYFVPIAGNLLDFNDGKLALDRGDNWEAGVSFTSGTVGMALDIVSLFPLATAPAQAGRMGLKTAARGALAYLKNAKAASFVERNLGAAREVKGFASTALDAAHGAVNMVKDMIAKVTAEPAKYANMLLGPIEKAGAHMGDLLKHLEDIPYIGKLLKPVIYLFKETIENLYNILSFKAIRHPNGKWHAVQDAIRKERTENGNTEAHPHTRVEKEPEVLPKDEKEPQKVSPKEAETPLTDRETASKWSLAEWKNVVRTKIADATTWLKGEYTDIGDLLKSLGQDANNLGIDTYVAYSLKIDALLPKVASIADISLKNKLTTFLHELKQGVALRFEKIASGATDTLKWWQAGATKKLDEALDSLGNTSASLKETLLQIKGSIGVMSVSAYEHMAKNMKIAREKLGEIADLGVRQKLEKTLDEIADILNAQYDALKKRAQSFRSHKFESIDDLAGPVYKRTIRFEHGNYRIEFLGNHIFAGQSHWADVQHMGDGNYQVTLSTGHRYSAKEGNSMIFGVDGAKANILFPRDQYFPGGHFELNFTKEWLKFKDKSYYGTLINKSENVRADDPRRNANRADPIDEFNATAGRKGVQKIDPKTIPEEVLSHESRLFFQNTSLPKPQYRMQLDGQDFLFTHQIKSESGRSYILGYAFNGSTYEPRLFYFSQSGGNWHCAPGLERGSDGDILSKGQFMGASYEKGTIVAPELASAFASLPSYSVNQSVSWSWKHIMGNLNTAEFKQRHGNEFRVSQFSTSKSFFELPRQASKQDVHNAFKNASIDATFDMRFLGGFRNGPSQTHPHLGEVETKIGKTTLQGKEVEVTFAYAKNRPDLVWIENIAYTRAGINSHGIPNETIHAGIFTAKPFEYAGQAPDALKNAPLFGGQYIDIREYIQSNPLVAKFKEINQYREAKKTPESYRAARVSDIPVDFEQTRTLFRDLSRKFHPDVNPSYGKEIFPIVNDLHAIAKEEGSEAGYRLLWLLKEKGHEEGFLQEFIREWRVVASSSSYLRFVKKDGVTAQVRDTPRQADTVLNKLRSYIPLPKAA